MSRSAVLVAWAMASAAMVVSCGGKTTSRADSDGSGTGTAGADGVPIDNAGAGGAASGSGGAPWDDDIWSLAGRAGAGGNSVQATGGVSGSGGEAGAEDDCPVGDLWEAVTDAAVGGLGMCGPWVCRERTTPAPSGALVFDVEGRLVDVVEVYELHVPKEEWLAGFEEERWPCLAGQTIDYCCSHAP